MPPKYDVIILTESRYENPEQTNDYINNVLLEDNLVKQALEAKGLKVLRKDWASENFDFSQAKVLLFRTVWDYFERRNEFIQWLKSIENKVKTINSIDTIWWNLDKHYLQDLQNAGINIPEFYIAKKGSKQTLQSIFKKHGFNEVVIKPTVSGGAYETYRVDSEEVVGFELKFEKLLKEHHIIVQKFEKDVLENGEISIMVFDGKFSHAIKKVAKPGDFRVQDDHGGTVHDYTPSTKEIDFAKQVVKACNKPTAYARVDYIFDENNLPILIELELFEPELWFRFNNKGADLLADAVLKQIS